MEALVEIKGFTGTTKKRTLTMKYTSVKCLIGSARAETTAFYENVPMGQLYEFNISDNRIYDLPDGSEITITHSQNSGIQEGSIFVVLARPQKQRIAGRNFITGACYLKE